MKKNRYSRALKILKSTEVDDKIKKLNESPTNNTKGVYSLNDPGFRVGDKDKEELFVPDVDGNWPDGVPGTPGEYRYVRPEGYWSGGKNWETVNLPDLSQDYLETDPTGRSTDTLISPDGVVKTFLPPGGRSFILGPVVDGFVPNHTSDAYTNIGYIQKDTRQFVLLARIQGQFKSGLNGNYPVWDGTSNGLTIYNQNFTLEMAQWVRDQVNSDKFVNNVPYFYSGGVPQRPQGPADCPNCPPGMYGGNGYGGGDGSGSFGWGQGGDPEDVSIGSQQGPSRSGDAKDAGYPWNASLKGSGLAMIEAIPIAQAEIFLTAILAGALWALQLLQQMGVSAWEAIQVLQSRTGEYPSGGPDTDNPYQRELQRKAREQSLPKEKSYERSDSPEKKAEREAADQKIRDAEQEVKDAEKSGSKDRIDRAYDNYENAVKNRQRVRQKQKTDRKAQERASGMPENVLIDRGVLSESRKRILKEIKKPVVVPEPPKKYKMNFSGKYSPQNTPDKTASRQSDELVASGNARGQKWKIEDKYWQGYETTERMNVIYDRVGHGDQYWEEIVKENQNKKSWRDAEVQEKLNIIAHEKAMIRENPNYESPFYKILDEQETVQVDKDPLFKRVSKKLKKDIDYPDKPSKNGVPNEPPPKMVNGWHPDYGKRNDYYNKLDPQSAAAMPETGDPGIDSEVKAARKKPK